MSRLGRGLFSCALAFGWWLLLVGELARAELLVGAACAVVAGIATELAWGEHLTAFSAQPRLLAQAFRLPGAFVRDTWVIFRVLARQLFLGRAPRSGLREAPFAAAPGDEREAATRRALAIAYTTMTPNALVLGIDAGRERVLYHQLEAGEVPALLERFGARP